MADISKAVEAAKSNIIVAEERVGSGIEVEGEEADRSAEGGNADECEVVGERLAEGEIGEVVAGGKAR